jgi:hypothetical protein
MNDNTKPLETCYRAMTKANAVVIDLKEPASVYSRYLGEPLLYLSLSESDLNTCFVKAALE